MSPGRDEFAEYMRELRTNANLSPFELVLACIEQNPFQCWFSFLELSNLTGLGFVELYNIIDKHSDVLTYQYPPTLNRAYVTLKKYTEAGYLLDSPDTSQMGKDPQVRLDKLPRSANEKAVF